MPVNIHTFGGTFYLHEAVRLFEPLQSPPNKYSRCITENKDMCMHIKYTINEVEFCEKCHIDMCMHI